MIHFYENIRAGIFFLFFGLVSSSTCSVMGQDNPKKTIRPEDYGLWGRLMMGQMTANGAYASWRMRYESGKDTLYVGKTSSVKEVLKMAGATNESFIGTSSLAYLDRNQMLTIIDLEDGKTVQKNSVSSYEVLDKTNLLLLRTNTGNGLHDFSFTDLSGSEQLAIKNVRTSRANADQSQIAIVTESSGKAKGLVVQLQNLKQATVAECQGALELPAWDPKGRFAAFAKSGKTDGTDRLYLYDAKQNNTSTFEGSASGLLSGGRHIGTIDATQLTVKEDGSAVFFQTALAMPSQKQRDSVVQIWNTSDKVLYPLQQIIDALPKNLLACWNLKSGKAFLLADDEKPAVALTGNKDFAIVWDQFEYEPQYERDGPVDLYLVDTKTGRERKWLTKMPLASIHPLVATNKILVRNNGWALYDPKDNSTLDLKITAPAMPQERLEEKNTPVSDKEGKYLLLTDGNDLWKVSTSDGKKTRLTFGREKGVIYQLPHINSPDQNNYGSRFLHSVDLAKPIIVQTGDTDSTRTGYSILFPNGTVKDIAFGPLGHSSLVSDKKYSTFAYLTESFASCASVNILQQDKLETLFVSNPHQKNYAWGKAVLVKYLVRGQQMRGILYCPENTDKNKKQPLVAHIYEIQHDQLYKMRLPAFLNATGFNVANFVGNGYYVLLPDILHGIGNPGMDATESLHAALDRVIADYPIDPSRLGLVGHSFGGYETAAVIGYTSRFKAAVMGAGISDAVSWYLSVNTNNSRPNFWRYETGQSRIGKSLFDDLDSYLANSPVLAAAKIETPLLIWTGANDRQVQPAQSYAMHLALRRLGKPSTMLVYPNEDHSVLGAEANTDLTLRLQQWFDHHLKGFETEWIK